MAVVERWPLWRGGRCREVAIVESWALWRGGHCRELAAVRRWPLVEVRLNICRRALWSVVAYDLSHNRHGLIASRMVKSLEDDYGVIPD